MARLTNLPVQQYRGTAAKTDAYTGPEGELTVTTDSHGLRIHDGAKKGGHAVAMAVQKILAGDGISVVGGSLGVDNTIAVKPATEDALGGLIVGKNLDVNADGTVSTKDWAAAVDELNADTGAALAPLLYDTAFVNVPGETATVIGRAIGELVWTLLPVRAAGFQLLDGSLIYSTGIYAAFYNYMVQLKNTGEHDNLFVTETAWQQSVTKYGVCGKFVLDTTAGTVRIPKVTGHVEGTIDKNAVGDLIEAGLPNITGNPGWVGRSNSGDHMSGAFYKNDNITSADRQNYVTSTGGAYFDASLSSPIYRDDINTVQTQSIKGYIYIIVGTYAKSDLQVNIDNVAGDLSHQGARITVVEDRVHIVETWQSDDGTSWYRKWSDGWIEQGGNTLGTTQPTSYTVTFPIAFVNSPPTIVVSGAGRNATADYAWGINNAEKPTATSFSYYGPHGSTGTPNGMSWYACGY